MNAFRITAYTLALGCLVAGGAVAGKIVHAATPTAVIVNSGSTNNAPFKVTVDANGRAKVGRGAIVSIGKVTAKRFFADVHAAQAKLSPSGAAMCFKSASFGSVMRVQAGAWSSVDLNCPVVGANAALKADVNAILAAVHLDTAPRRITLPPNEPRKMPNETPSSTPQPAATP